MDKRNFHVTIKGLYFDDHGRVLLMREHDGVWDLPGGRLEHGEDFSTALKRECREEMGIECGIRDTTPYWAWSALDRDGLWKVVLCFRITLPHLEFIPSDECVAVGFYDDTGLATIPVAPQLQALAGLLAKNPRHL